MNRSAHNLLFSLVWGILLFSCSTVVTTAASDDGPGNLLHPAEGAVIVSAPQSRSLSDKSGVGPWSPEALVDGSRARGWAASAGSNAPFIFVFELAYPAAITSISLDNRCEDERFPGCGARSATVEGSVEGSTSGFTTLWTGDIPKAQQLRQIKSSPETCRWIRLTITSNWGHPAETELMEFQAHGRFMTAEAQSGSVAGTYQTQWGSLNLVSTGNQVAGSYENGGKVEGYLSGYSLLLNWRETTNSGSAALVLNAEGSRLNGIYWLGPELTEQFGYWNGTRTSVIPSPLLPAEEPVWASQLRDTGRGILYGITFDTGLATIRPDAFPTLDVLAKQLRADPQLRLTIEGHTDDVGSEEANLKLARQRAEAVRQSLIARYGIDGRRLLAVGRGEAQPLAPNDTQAGRAANRRVEIRR